MRKQIWLMLVVVLLFCGCAADVATTGPSTTAMTIPTTLPVPTTQAATTVPTTAPAETVGPAPVVNMYAGAVEDLLPIEEAYSDPRLYPPEMVMIHFSSAVLIDRNDPYNLDLIRNIFAQYEVSPHYIIDRDGTIYCYVTEDRVAWHAGKGTWAADEKYTNAMNQYAIGIELVAMGSKNDMKQYLSGKEYDAMDQSLMGFTQEQYEALAALVQDLCQRHNIPLDRQHIIGHDEYAKKKTDPGELFDWSKIVP